MKKIENPMVPADNKHVWEYLSYYLSLGHAPRFAVLISGPWGVGKTHLLKAFLREKFAEDSEGYVYVSLYGLSNIEEIDDALFQAVFPALTGTSAKVLGRVAKAGLKFLKVEPGDWNIKEFLNKFNAEIYVFDDLERCEAPVNKVLGYINQFVEHGGAKVVILANEQEIGATDDYKRRREKLIGKTLMVQSEFEAAFAHFASNIDDEKVRLFIQAKRSEITSIYHLSALNNLRILQQTMWDFERFYGALSSEHQTNESAMVTLLRILVVLSFEFKAGRISEEDLRSRGTWSLMLSNRDKDKPRHPMTLAAERYPMIEVNDEILSNELLVNYLVRGIIDAEAIHKELKASRFFISVADEAAWRTVWHWYERSDAEFEGAVSTMEAQFAARDFSNDGEILHVFGLRLFLADRGILPFSRDEILAQGKKYIDDLYAKRKLPIRPHGQLLEARYDGWGGLGIHENQSPEYKELFSYLVDALQRTTEDTYPARAGDLLSYMKEDVQRFLQHVCWTRDGGDMYVNAPVLAKLDVSEFVSVFLALPPNDQRIVMIALKGRYESGQLEGDLKDEKPWLTSVRDTFLARMPELSIISRYRLHKNIEWYFKAIE